MPNSQKEILIKKLHNQSCTKEEFEQLFEIVRDLPQKEAFPIMEELWKQMEQYPKLSKELSSTIYQHTLHKIPQKEVVKLKPRKRFSRSLLRIAASILFLVAAAITYQLLANNSTIITTAYAEQRSVALPDGSLVHLNANSRLSYKNKWSDKGDRKVWLEGEAFFEVAKKETTGQKFLVVTSDLTVEVLGTVFNVNTHQEKTTVFLEEGKIALQLKNQASHNKIMKPGEVLSYSAERKKILSNTEDTKAKVYTSWKDGILTFDETPLQEVIEKIEIIYGIDLVTEDTINYKREITTGLPMEELDIVLPILEQALGLKINKEGDQYLIK